MCGGTALVMDSLKRSTHDMTERHGKSAVINDDNVKVHKWIIGDQERSAICDALGLKKHEIPFSATLDHSERQDCQGCGRQMQLLDEIYSALKTRTHSPDFIKEELCKDESDNTSGLHYVYCARCDVPFRELAGWPRPSWRA